MTDRRVRANGKGVSRRTLLSALPASGAAVALPAAAETGETEILRLFRQHSQIMETAENHVCDARSAAGKDQEMESLFWQNTDRIEAEMMALESTCAADVAAKMLVSHNHGHSSLHEDHPLWVEARRLTGLAELSEASA